ncbi:MAG: DUF2029 domain-containing protein [Parvularculaceae bacterium]|nr:MAG: DUF2029 domain-containing protein [Parvularculaceae bacterium]
MQTAIGHLETSFPLLHALATRWRGKTLLCAAFFLLAMQWGVFTTVLLKTEDYILPQGSVVGGDFTVFHEAAKAALTDPAELYGFKTLNARLAETFPAYEDDFRLGWLYPPAMYFLTAPFAGLNYYSAYILWVSIGIFGFLAAGRMIWKTPQIMLFLVACPAVFQTVITGQTGLMTAGVFALAAWSPDRRPIIAGLAAAALTVKPQLGLLLPIAYLACGAWRAFFIAAAGTIIVHLSAYGVFGHDTFIAFVDAAAMQGSHLAGDIFPYAKLTSIYGFAATAGLPKQMALLLQIMVTLGLCLFIWRVWRRVKSPELRFASLATASAIAVPYLFYYELPLVVLGLLALAKYGKENGWLSGEGLALGALWIAPMMMPGMPAPSLPVTSLAAIAAFALILRRIYRIPSVYAYL